MRLQLSDFKLTYVAGKEVPVADALSRAAPKLVSEGTSIAQATEMAQQCSHWIATA